MSYESVDQLQKVLTKEVFHYAKDAKKAAGRALGTLVEIITFYTLKSWGFEHNIAIERPLPEFANGDITHNVEYSLHPSKLLASLPFHSADLPLTARKIRKLANGLPSFTAQVAVKQNSLLNRFQVLRNCYAVGKFDSHFINAYLDGYCDGGGKFHVVSLLNQPFAILECKRVGVEEGMKKGPQTIEKAKQGAYVARAVSVLQKIRLADGRLGGVIPAADGILHHGDYYQLLDEIIQSNEHRLLSQFILTIGVVSNHGNWFTSNNQNKELKVLAQSYDWLLFLTDYGLSRFIQDLLLSPVESLMPVRTAFLASYPKQKAGNLFTKVCISLDADVAMQRYFRDNLQEIEQWFNVISPSARTLGELRRELELLKHKDWEAIYK